MKMLLGSRGLAKEEMNSLLKKFLRYCEGQEEYKEVKALVANEMLNYRGPSHGKELQVFSEYYFYMLAFIKRDAGSNKELSPTIYRIDRITRARILEEHFRMSNSWKFDESQFREQTPFMFGSELKNLKFWYSGPSLEAIQDKIPTVKILDNEDGRYLLSAQVLGDGAEMWLRSQGKYVSVISNEKSL